MGNSTSEIVSRVSEIRYEEAKKLLNQDIELLHDTSIVFSSAKLSIRNDLSVYKIGDIGKKKSEEISNEDEQGLVYSQEIVNSAKDRNELTVKGLMKDIMQTTEIDIASAEICKRLQAFCRIFEAILRVEECKKKSPVGDENSTEGQLPTAAKAAIKFGLSTLLNLIECVSAVNPMLFEFIINDANAALSDSSPLSLSTSDSTLQSSFERIASFFDSVICGKITSLPSHQSLLSILPFFKLASVSGSVPSLLQFTKRLLHLKNLSTEIKQSLFPLLKSFNNIPITSNLYSWNSVSKGDNIEVSNNVIKGNLDNDTGSVYSTLEFSHNIYVGILVNKANENCYFGVCDSGFNEKTAWNNGSSVTIAYCSGSTVFSKAAEVFKMEPWAVNDKIGVFVDFTKKTVVFYRNGEKQKGEPIKFLSEKIKFYANLSKESQIELLSGIDCPADISDLFVPFKPTNSPFQDLLQEDSPSETYLSQPLGETLVFILKKLADGLAPVEYLFSLRNYKFEHKKPTFSFQICPTTFACIQELQDSFYTILESSDFSVIPESAVQSAIFSIQKLITYNLILNDHLGDKSVSEEIKKKILNQTINFIKNTKFPDLSEGAMKLLSSCFEIFYKSPKVKLEYINEVLERNEKEKNQSFVDLEAKIFNNIARPDKIFPILDCLDDAHMEIIKRFYYNLLNKAQKDSEELIKGEGGSRSVVHLLSSSQAGLFAQAGKNEFKGQIAEFVNEYILLFLNSSLTTLRNCKEVLMSSSTGEIAANANSSIIGTVLEELLNSLILFPLDVKAIGEIHPLISELSAGFSGIPSFESVLSMGIGIIEEIYESPHNYLDNCNISHTIKVPCAIKYTLEFDPQCKTENGCDYLELWMEEAASNKLHRWEGDNWPKEPLDILNPILHFTFHSDGSVNYWGWKITIKAVIETSYYKKQWPETTKDTIELFFGKCATKMVSGEFEVHKAEDDVLTALKNPLFQYGISDSALAFVHNLPLISESIQKISSEILKPVEYLVSPSLRPFTYLPNYEIGLREYLGHYNSIISGVFSQNPFLTQFVEGSEDLNSAWTALKKKAGVVGGSFAIGGAELDQAERSIFSVYSSFFEITETVKQILTGQLEAGATIKTITKESCQIRSWAQKHKQKLFDSGKTEVTYKSISDDIVKKCAILVGSDYKSALNQIGISKVMKNLASNIAAGQKKSLKLGSKWKNVKEALKSAKKLNSLVSINKKSTKQPNEDLKEFYRVVELVKGFLETPASVEKITEALSSRRIKGIIRSLGYLSISKLISYSTTEHETFIVKAFSDSMKTSDSKLNYLDSIEAVDPLLMKSVQQGFFLVLKSIQEDIIAAANSEFNYELFSHFTSAIEALSWKFRGEDLHFLVNQPITALIRTLLKWAKGDIKQEAVKGKFNVEKCVTRVGVLTEEAVPEGKTKILIEKIEGQPSVYLVLDFGGAELPITKFVIETEPREDLEEAVPEFSHQGVNKKIYVYREEPGIFGEYLVGVGEDLVGKFEKYDKLLGEPNVEEIKKLNKLKEGLGKNSWNLFKQLVYTLVGAWHGSSETTHLKVQEKCLKVIFSELQPVVPVAQEPDFNVKDLLTGKNWLSSNKVLHSKPRCPMDVWLSVFTQNPQIELAELINTYVAYIDPLGKGLTEVADSEDLESNSEAYRSESGQIDFFKFLAMIKSSVNESDELEKVRASIQDKDFWQNWPNEQHFIDYTNVQGVIQALVSAYNPGPESVFAPYLELFKESNGSFEGSKLKTPAEAEFLVGTQVDLYKTLTEIKSNSKFASTLAEISGVYSAYPELPNSIDAIRSLKQGTNEYSASLLLTIYSAFTSDCLPKALSHDSYIKTLVSYITSFNSITLYTLSCRILSKILPTQHSPQSFSNIWVTLPPSSHPDLTTLLLNQIGKSLNYTEDRRFAYESRNLLNFLLQSPRWQDSILNSLLNTLESTVQHLNSGEVLNCEQAGALLFVSNNFYAAKVPFTFAAVTLKDTSFTRGIVKEVLSDGKFSVYSIVDDSSAQVEFNKVVSIDNAEGVSVFKTLGKQGAKICEYLFEIWHGLNKSFTKPLKTAGEGFVMCKVAYKALQNVVVTSFADALDEISVDANKLALVLKDLVQIKPERENVSVLDYVEAGKVLKTKIAGLMEAETQLTVEEINEQVNLLEEDSKNGFKVLLESGVSPQFAYKCIKAGIKEPEKVSNYSDTTQSALLYKLSLIDEGLLNIEDIEGHAEIYQNSQYHFIISDTRPSQKHLEFSLPNKLFDVVKYFLSEVTIYFALEIVPNEDQFSSKINIGTFELNISADSVEIEGNSVPIPKNQIVIFKIISNVNGQSVVSIENVEKTVTVNNRTIFNGLNIGKFKLALTEGSLLSLSMLEVHSNSVSIPFTNKVEKTFKNETNERFVKIKTKSSDSFINKLKLLGISQEQAEQVRRSTNSFTEAVDLALNTLTPSLNLDILKKDSEIISEIKLFDTPELVPADFQAVKVYENFQESDFVVADRKVLAYKKSVNDTGLLGINIGEMAGYESLGELNLAGDSRVFNIFTKSGKFSPKDPPFKSIIFIKCSSLYNVPVPSNYTILTDKEGKAINVSPKPKTEKPYYLFIAYNKTTEFLSIPINKLESILPKFTTFGLSESARSESSKKFVPTDFSSFSLTTLYSFIHTYESNTLSTLSDMLILKSLQKNPDYFYTYRQHLPITQIFSYLDSSFVLKLDLSTEDSLELSQILISESIASLLKILVPTSSSGRVLKPIVVESTHPYDNNMDLDDVIAIPGATCLRIEFDPQCHTENGCDPLRFYESAGRTGEIRNLSGQGESVWVNFEVPGDTVHTYFHSDGSVVYWGYKFEVIPIGGGSGPPAEKNNHLIALEILKKVVKEQRLAKLVLNDQILCPLFVYLIGSTNVEEKMCVLEILKHFTEGLKSEIGEQVVSYLGQCADTLYLKSFSDKSSHNVLQSLIQILFNCKKQGIKTLNKEWFLDLADLLSDMSGLTEKSEALELFLFDIYKGTTGTKLNMDFESEHPYMVNTKSKEVKILGAHSLKFEFSKDSKIEPDHSVFFSKDSQKICNSLNNSSSVNSDARWEHKGPDIEFSQEGLRVTRTNSNGWGGALMNIILNSGITSLNFLVENDGSSDYIYIGLVEAQNFSDVNLGECFNNDNTRPHWAWKRNGEIYITGSQSSAVGFATGDKLKFTINFELNTIFCYKNGVEAHKFTQIGKNLIPFISYGSTGQFVVLQSVETTNEKKLEGRTVNVLGDCTYLWFPVNVGYFNTYTWDFETNEKCSISANNLELTKLNDESLSVPALQKFSKGKNYFQVKVSKPQGLEIAVLPEDDISDKLWASENALKFAGDSESPFNDNDLIGVLLNFDSKTVSFYLNKKLVLEKDLVPEKSYGFFCTINKKDTIVSIVNEEPEWLDILKIDTDRVSQEFGYKVKVTPEFKGRSQGALNIILSSSSQEFRDSWESYKSTLVSIFKSGAAEEMTMFVDNLATTKTKDPLKLTQEDINLQKNELIYYPELEKVEEGNLFKLYQVLQNFNQRVQDSIFLFDLNMKSDLTFLQKVLIGSRSFIFFDCKNKLLKTIMDKTKSDIRTEITIDRPKAARYRNKKLVDVEGQFSIFGQIYRAMSAVPNTGYRNVERIYKVNYRGEGSIDAGGPYNESLSNMCDELTSSFLRLLIPTSNNTNNMGEYRDAWQINPSASTQTDLSLFKFLGKLMGASIRTQNNLNLSLPPIFWKSVLREKLSVRDLRSIDVCTVQILEILKDPSKNDLTPDNFSQVYEEKFVAKDSNGGEIELIEGGKNIEVTFENCGEYADLVIKARLSEGVKAYDAVREGLGAVVPTDYLNLMSYKQLETLVCGATDVSVDILKENTDYDGCSLTDQHIINFWEVLKGFSARERTLFLKFVWGRTKLPAGKDWRHMKVTRLQPAGPVNNYMPVSHTCFFTLDLPAYTTKEAMQQKLLYAITHCTAIDLDGAAGQGWEDDD